MNASSQLSSSSSPPAVSLIENRQHRSLTLSLKGQPEAAAYFDLSCDEAICDAINHSLDELDLPDFFTA